MIYYYSNKGKYKFSNKKRHFFPQQQLNYTQKAQCDHRIFMQLCKKLIFVGIFVSRWQRKTTVRRKRFGKWTFLLYICSGFEVRALVFKKVK